MANESFRIEIDHARRFLRVTLHGHWERGTVDRYRDGIRAAVRTMTANGYGLEDALVLVDTRALAVQGKDVADYYSEVPIYSAAQPRKLATLAASRLVGMQVRRISTGIQQIFDDEGEALNWLFGAP